MENDGADELFCYLIFRSPLRDFALGTNTGLFAFSDTSSLQSDKILNFVPRWARIPAELEQALLLYVDR